MGANFYDYTYKELSWRGIEIHNCQTDLDSIQEFNLSFVIESQQFVSGSVEVGATSMQEVDQWCQDNLMGYFKIDVDRSSFQYEDDAMAFKLMWSE